MRGGDVCTDRLETDQADLHDPDDSVSIASTKEEDCCATDVWYRGWVIEWE